jgi:tRNA(fMet)-specific endonuclease VapC
MIVLDTDHLSVLEYRDSPRAFELQARLEAESPTELFTTVVSLEEQMRGWLALIARYSHVEQQVAYYSRLLSMHGFFSGWQLLPFDADAAREFQRLRSQGVRIGTMALKIASIVLSRNAILLSANLSDFEQVPGLRVENWLLGN